MKIFDTFTFFNELDLLEIRLNILDKVVDTFVIVEATRTFQNRPKPLFFQENKDRFSRFLPKIIHVVVEDMPDSNNTRLLEHHQRDAIARGLTACQTGDQVILSDLDEIPDPNKVGLAAKLPGLKAFRQSLYYYFINLACVELATLPWSIMCNYEDLEAPQELRNRLISVQALLLGGQMDFADIELIPAGGWHFSYLGGLDAVIRKLESFADPEYGKPQYRDVTRIETAIQDGVDLFGRDLKFTKVPIDESFPEYIRVNESKIRQLITPI